MIRAFLAVELGAELRERLTQVQQDLKQRLARDLSKGVRISWVRPDSVHLTIKFLGDIDEQLVEPLRDALSNLMQAQQTIQVPVDRLGVFPHPNQPRVLWVGPSDAWERGDDAKRLAVLHRTIDACCATFDLAPDSRPMSPHLTLARIKEGERSVGQSLAKSGVLDRPVALGSLVVGPVVLMKSELRPTGSVYTKLWEAV
jgi:2'-5' RNA ligase